ncbi:HupE/UreJ family protein [Mesorhizobium sp. BAC0120]|uniref:HupE/UreJ family protein n=1 Tax=Mesorhizobium sp. BAC0120 TaxID=3090670 RepID=UPI00298D097C|nr:HupE/UreJ family protein [Mesorhizobium sp. BAC0120]MDW6024636.1 HupE/UreJ family protein [Mesorhizobium sp. BAC0120]
MLPSMTRKAALSALLLAAAAAPAYAHVGVDSTSSFATGFGHPLSGLDHVTVMIAVGLWAALKGGRAIWAWPAAFVGVMLIGGTLGMLHVPFPFVEPGILASVVAFGLLVALAVDLPVAAGSVVIALFALLHGNAHGTEVPESAGGLDYMAGFALATVLLHGVGIAAGLGLSLKFRYLVRAAGAACAAIGVGLALGAI